MAESPPEGWVTQANDLYKRGMISTDQYHEIMGKLFPKSLYGQGESVPMPPVRPPIPEAPVSRPHFDPVGSPDEYVRALRKPF